MASTLDKEDEYEKMVGFATVNGQMFEVNVASLLFLRCLKRGLDFQLASNVAGAGALDDIVLHVKYPDKPATTCFLQLKYRANSNAEITNTMLVDAKSKLTVNTYWKGYQEINKTTEKTKTSNVKRAFFDGENEERLFVMFTNAKGGDDLGIGRPLATGSIEELIGSGSGKDVFSFDLKSDVAISLKRDPGVDVFDFLDNFRVFCGQPSLGDFHEYFKIELKEIKAAQGANVDADELCKCFVREMSEWREKSNVILNKNSKILQSAIDLVAMETCSVREKGNYRLNVCYNEEALEPLRTVLDGKFSVLHIVSSEKSLRLSYTKFFNATKTSHWLLSIGSLLENKEFVFSQFKSGKVTLLVICVNEWQKTRSQRYLLLITELCCTLTNSTENTDTLKTSPNAKQQVVIFSPENNEIHDELGKLEKIDLQTFVDTCKFSQIREDERSKILEKQFMHQAHKTTFKMALGNDSKHADCLDAASVLKMIESDENLILGPVLADNISYYVHRKLEQVICMEESLFDDSSIEDNITIENATTKYVQSILVKYDLSLSLRKVEQIFQAQMVSCAVPPRGAQDPNETVFVGQNFVLGKFSCSVVCLQDVKALRIHLTRADHTENESHSGWYLFLNKNTNEKEACTLSEFNKSKHILSLKGTKLQWKKSFVAVSSLRDHVKQTEAESSRPNKCTDITERSVIVCGQAGMGKSTLLSQLAIETKKAYAHFWVIYISLNDHSKLFDNEADTNALKFILDAAVISQPLQRSFLELALHTTGNICIFLDGYDEIAPRYAKRCCNLLTGLLQTKAKHVWITSRNTVKDELEEHLATFASKLLEFDEDDRRKFLKLYWKIARDKALKSGINILSEEDLDAFITHLLLITSRAINDRQREFLGIPLQAQIVAEVFEELVIAPVISSTQASQQASPHLINCISQVEKLDLLQLLHKFVEIKLVVYVQDRLRIQSFDTNYYHIHLNTFRKMFVKSHKNAALILILGDEDVGHLHSSRKLCTEAEEFFKTVSDGQDKTGFIDAIVNGKPRFIHRVFAEYFAAEWFVEHFARNTLILKKIFFTTGFKIIRNLFNSILASDPPKKKWSMGDEIFIDINNNRILQIIIEEDLEQLMEFCLDQGLSVNHNLRLSRSLLHDACRAGSVQVTSLLIARGANLMSVDERKATPLHLATSSGYLETVGLVLRAIRDQFLQGPGRSDACEVSSNDEEAGSRTQSLEAAEAECVHRAAFINAGDKDGNTAMHLAAENWPPFRQTPDKMLEIIKSLHEAGGSLSQVNRMKRTPLIVATVNNYQNRVECMLEIFKEDREGVQASGKAAFINMRDSDDRSALHHAASSGFTGIVASLIKHGADVRNGEENRLTPLLSAVKVGMDRLDVIKLLVESVSEAERADFVNIPDVAVSSALHLAIECFQHETVVFLVEAGGNLTQRDSESHTALLLAAGQGATTIVSYLLEAIGAETREGPTNQDDCQPEASGIETHMNMTNEFGMAPLHLAAYNGWAEATKILIDHVDIRSVDADYGGTALHWAVYKNVNVIDVLLDACDASERVEFVNLGDGDGDTALHWAAADGNADAVERLVKAGAKLASVNYAGQTALMGAAEKDHGGVVELLLSAFVEEEEGMRKVDYKNMIVKV